MMDDGWLETAAQRPAHGHGNGVALGDRHAAAHRESRSRFPHHLTSEQVISPLAAQFGIIGQLRILSSAHQSPSRSPVRGAHPRLPLARSPTRSPTPLPIIFPSRSPLPTKVAPGGQSTPAAQEPQRELFNRVLSSSTHNKAEEAMAKIRNLQAGLFHRINSSSAVLRSAEQLIEECGKAILSWFGSLSGPALVEAIKEAFVRFDTDGSGLINRQEFSHAMHTMGVRLTEDQYDVLFKKCDVDNSGEIDLGEFTHMIRLYLKKACDEDCHTCKATGGSNQPGVVYRPRWVQDESLLSPAASKLQNGLVAALTRQDYAEFKDDPDFWSDDSQNAATDSVGRFRRSRASRRVELEGHTEGHDSTVKTPLPVRPYMASDRERDSDMTFDMDEDDQAMQALTPGKAGEGGTIRGLGKNVKAYHGLASAVDAQTTEIETAAADAHRVSSVAAEEARQANDSATAARNAAVAARVAAAAAASSSYAGYSAAERQGLLDAAEAAEQSAADAEARAAAATAAAANAEAMQIHASAAARRASQLDAWKEQRRILCEDQHSPNYNLNHDADQLFFRGASYLTANAPRYERKLRPGIKPSLDSSEASDGSDGYRDRGRIASMFDDFQGPLPPLARGTLFVREGLVLSEQRPQTRDKGAHHISLTGSRAHPPPSRHSPAHNVHHCQLASPTRTSLRLGCVSRGSTRDASMGGKRSVHHEHGPLRSHTIEQHWAHEEALPGLAHMFGGRGGNPQYPGTTHYWTDDHTEQLIRRHAGTGGGARILSPMALTLTIRTSTFSPV